ncbi:MAG: M20/M25/M40 family metallo-hydrolase [Planctomycetes bacterium]|nr:M20/M25/M40 family metallo-hydrolase [Planctomycetota bacterium]
MRTRWLAALLLFVSVAFAQEADDVQAARDTITSADLQKQLEYVCSELEGRKSASKGERLTAEYVGAEFKKYGLQEAGTEGYLQEFPVKQTSGTGYNVFGTVEGSDPALRETCVIVTAHLDAVGGVGADDNGSGLVGVLELAQAFAALKAKPKRSVLFMACGSEELWMVGSYYYVKHTTKFPLASTIANVNLDMIGRNNWQEDILISGCESAKPQFNDLVEKHAKQSGLKYVIEDPKISPPGDVMPFYEKNIPFLYFYTHGYGKLHVDYHRKTDTPNKIDYANQEKIVRLAFHIILDMANLETAPERVRGYRFPHPMQGKPKRRIREKEKEKEE